MSDEKNDFIESILKLLAVCIFAILYSIGGWGHLWCRRYVAPVELTIAVFIFSRGDWRSFTSLIGIGSLCLGYSAHSLVGSIFRRGLFGVANGIAFSITNLLNKRFILGFFQIILVPITCIILGVWNPLPNARTEELVIGFEMAFIPIMSARKV